MHLQGANASALEKEIGSEQFPVNEHYFGLVNVRKWYTVQIQYLNSFPIASYSHLLFSMPCVILVWEHLLLQLGAAGSVLLSAISGKDLGISQSASAEGEPAHLPGWPVP